MYIEQNLSPSPRRSPITEQSSSLPGQRASKEVISKVFGYRLSILKDIECYHGKALPALPVPCGRADAKEARTTGKYVVILMFAAVK
jgi:hypothetical protein